jgi:hypothetical protein
MPKPKPTKAQVEARVTEILRIRLDGAEIWDVREYVREMEQQDGWPWQLAEGQKRLSDSQLWRYIARADREMEATSRACRRKLRRRHLAQRRALYAKALASGDYRTALAVLKDEAELRGLYPPKKHEHTGKDGKPLIPPPEMSEDERLAAMAAIVERFAAGGPRGPAAPAGRQAPAG